MSVGEVVGPSEPPFSRGDLAFVTARPDDALSLIEGATRESLAKAGIASVNVIGGSFLALRSKDDMAAKKVANIDNYSRLFPEYRIVFIGDSGQGDPLTGETIMQAPGIRCESDHSRRRCHLTGRAGGVGGQGVALRGHLRRGRPHPAREA